MSKVASIGDRRQGSAILINPEGDRNIDSGPGRLGDPSWCRLTWKVHWSGGDQGGQSACENESVNGSHCEGGL